MRWLVTVALVLPLAGAYEEGEPITLYANKARTRQHAPHNAAAAAPRPVSAASARALRALSGGTWLSALRTHACAHLPVMRR